MAQVKLLKIASDGIPLEMDTASDDVTLASYTVTGGGPVLDANLDMNNGNVSDVNDLSFTDPTTDGITVTSGTFPADTIMFESEENVMTTAGAVLFPVVTDTADQVDAFRLPALAGVPSATPSDGGEGYQVWDSTNNDLYIWDGAAWDNQNTVSDAENIVNSYNADEILLASDCVYISANNAVSKASASAGGTSEAIGFAVAGAAAAAAVDVKSDGIIGGLSAMTAGDRMYLSTTAGLITSTIPVGAGNTVVQVGYSKNATDLSIQLQSLGRRAS